MKRTLLALCLLLASGGSLSAADLGDDGIAILCGDIRLPSLSAVAVVTGSGNAGDAYRTREVLLHQAERLCKGRGVAMVRFVPEAQVSVEPLLSVVSR